MNIALLRVPLTLAEINHLIKEFPQYLFLSYPEKGSKEISPEIWSKVEILFGNRLTSEELAWAQALKWIHTPSSQFHRLSLSEIEQKGNILVTCTREEHRLQVSEFIMGAILAFAKNFFHWKELNQSPNLLWDAKWRQNMWSLPGRVLVQIGMDKTGAEIAKKAAESGMKVYSIDKERTFHPWCHRNLSIQDLHEVLPEADVICVNLPRTREYRHWFGLPELELLNEDTILIVLGPSDLFAPEIMHNPALFEKLRGLLIDIPFETPLSSQSKLWSLPNVLITPDVAPRPKSKVKEAYRLFRSNLRQYIHDNFRDMRHLVDTSIVLAGEETWI